MGSSQSVPSTQEINDVSRKQRSDAVGNSHSARRGQETTKTNNNETNKVSTNVADLTEKLSLSSSEVVDDESVVSTDSSEYDSEEEELDEEFESKFV